MRSWHERKARHRGQVGHALTASSPAAAAPQPDVRIADAKTAAGRMPAPLLTSDNFRLSVVRRELSHHVSLDKAIKTLRETGADMKDKYQETARGGLAVNVIEC